MTQKNKTKTQYLQTFITALFMLAKNYKQFKCLSTYKWVNQMWYIHTMKYYSAMKKNKQTIDTWYKIDES